MTQEQNNTQKNNPLHGITLEQIVTDLEAHYGWHQLGQLISIRCFQKDPSVKSSLKFLRKTPWARSKVEELYIETKNSPWKSF
ncbi:MAG: VF530 family protein [Amphritea sp.]